MKRMKKLLLLFGFGLLLTSCSITYPVMVTDNPIGTKVGKASGNCYFRAICIDTDYSLQSAAKNGGIKKIATVDIKVTNVLGIIWTFETTVTGE
jgi:hypothetical protein